MRKQPENTSNYAGLSSENPAVEKAVEARKKKTVAAPAANPAPRTPPESTGTPAQ